jgi:DNA-binding CsgD family transcriptional regulator
MVNTERQNQVMAFTVSGFTAKEIGEMLGISSRTVEQNLTLMKAEHHAKNIPHLVAIFFRKGLIS